MNSLGKRIFVPKQEMTEEEVLTWAHRVILAVFMVSVAVAVGIGYMVGKI